jgi:hypothetical protein
MTKISSGSTFFYKRVFPLLGIGFIVVGVGIPIAMREQVRIESGWPVLLFPVMIALIWFVIFRKLIWDLADEVYDGGDHLLIKMRGEEERVALSNIMNVSAATYVNPMRVTLRLIKPGRFGPEITFTPQVPRFSLNRFGKNPIAEDLIVRAHEARSRSRA